MAITHTMKSKLPSAQATEFYDFMVGIPLIILIQVVIIVFVFDSSLSVGHYEIVTDKTDGQIRLALIADLH